MLRTRRWPVLLPLVAGLLAVSPGAGASSLSAQEAAVSRTVTVSGTGVQTYPAYDEGISRFGVTTTAQTDGKLTLTPTSGDPAADITVNGRAAVNGRPVQLSGLASGDEVNVRIVDAGGTSNQSWIYLPSGFPRITAESQGAGPAPGSTLLTLSGAGPVFATAVDANGVPTYVSEHSYAQDFNLQPNGNLTVATTDRWGLFEDWDIVERDLAGRHVATHKMLNSPKTDFHDSILLPGGGRILMAYVQGPDGQTDSRLQEVGPDGSVLLDWNSRDHVIRDVDPIDAPLGDYAHLNSMQVMSDGNLLLSMRHYNQVMKIDRRSGEVIWRLGGARSDFTFPDDPWGGPCAQHTARELANGDIQIFDNGSGTYPQAANPMCPDPGDPEGEPVHRPSSRVTVYHLDHQSNEASLVQEFRTDEFSQFAGSAQRLGDNTLDDHVLVGQNNPVLNGGQPGHVAIEFDAEGNKVWSLSSPGMSTYRAQKYDIPDVVEPTISGDTSLDGKVLEVGAAPTAPDMTCGDRGGSNLDSCEASHAPGSALPATPGTHTFTVTARDRAGNTSSRVVRYTIAARSTTQPAATGARVDATIRKRGGSWKAVGTRTTKRANIAYTARKPTRLVAFVRISNTGDAADVVVLRSDRSTRWAKVRWFAGKKDVTKRVVAGKFRTANLQPGKAQILRLVVDVTHTRKARNRVLGLTAAPASAPDAIDVVGARIRVR